MDELKSHIISEFERTGDEKLRLGLRAYNGKVYFDIRIWFTDRQQQILLPSRRGICLNLEHLPQMKSFIETLENVKKDSLPEEILAAEKALETVKSAQSEPGRGWERPKTAAVPAKGTV